MSFYDWCLFLFARWVWLVACAGGPAILTAWHVWQEPVRWQQTLVLYAGITADLVQTFAEFPELIPSDLRAGVTIHNVVTRGGYVKITFSGPSGLDVNRTLMPWFIDQLQGPMRRAQELAAHRFAEAEALEQQIKQAPRLAELLGYPGRAASLRAQATQLADSMAVIQIVYLGPALPTGRRWGAVRAAGISGFVAGILLACFAEWIRQERAARSGPPPAV